MIIVLIKCVSNPTPEFHSDVLFPGANYSDNVYISQSSRKKQHVPSGRVLNIFNRIQ